MSRRGALTLCVGAGVIGVTGCSGVVQWQAQRLSRRLERQHLHYGLRELGDGLEIGAWTGAGGEPVLLLHGFGAAGMWQWHPQVAALLDAGYGPIIPDLLWFGESRDERRDYRIARQVEAMIALLDALEVDTCHVAGISYGGIVAHDLCARARTRIQSATLISSPGRAFLSSDQKPLLEHHGVDSMAELLLPTDSDGVQRLFELAYVDPPRINREIRRQIVDYFYTDVRAERIALLDAIAPSIEELRVIDWIPDQPTLVVWGREDRVFPLPASDRLVDELGQMASLVVVDDAGHAPHLERSGFVNEVFLNFLAGSVT